MVDKPDTIWRKVLRVHDYLCDGCFWIGGFLLFIMVFTTTYDVIMRNLFSRPTRWSIDFAEYSLMFSCFLAAAWLCKTDNHIKITMVQEKLEKKAKLKLEIFNFSIGAITCALLAWRGAIDLLDAIEQKTLITRSLTIPKWLLFWVIPFGLFLFSTYFIRNVFSLISQLKQAVESKD
jgi:TRAP-type C4-dicarboxylate transport system permease small subunit